MDPIVTECQMDYLFNHVISTSLVSVRWLLLIPLLEDVTPYMPEKFVLSSGL